MLIFKNKNASHIKLQILEFCRLNNTLHNLLDEYVKMTIMIFYWWYSRGCYIISMAETHAGYHQRGTVIHIVQNVCTHVQ
jgi:hypothetical protein